MLINFFRNDEFVWHFLYPHSRHNYTILPLLGPFYQWRWQYGLHLHILPEAQKPSREEEKWQRQGCRMGAQLGFNWFHLILFVTVRHLLLARKRVHISCTIHITPWPIPQLIRHAVDRWFVSLRGNRPEWLNWGFAEWKWINGTLLCNILRWHDEEEFVVFMGLLCQHFRVLVPLMSAPLEQSITPNTGAINVYSLLEFTASLVPISGLWPTQSKAVNEWQFIESPSTGRSMPSAGTDEDSKATAKGNPEAIILIFRVKSTRI